MSERSERIIITAHARSAAEGTLMGADRREHP